MGMRGVHFAIDDSVLQTLKAFEATEEIQDYVTESIERSWDPYMPCETDKAWAMIHEVLVGSNPQEENLQRTVDAPAAWVILGREDLVENDDGFVTLLHRDDVAKVAAFLGELGPAGFTKQMRDLMTKYECDEVDDDDVEYASSMIPGLVTFYNAAASAKRHVIFAVDY